MGKSTDLRQQLLELYHGSATGGHSGVQPTYLRLKRHFYWQGLLADVMHELNNVMCVQGNL